MPGSRPSKSAPDPLAWSTEEILPDGFAPMQAASAAGPLDSEHHAYEPRWEGARVLAGLEGNRLVARSATGQDLSARFPELQGLREVAEPFWILFDGELVVLRRGRVDREALQQRLVADPAGVERQSRESPATLMLYDVLRLGDSWLLDVYWAERRDILRRVITPRAPVALSPVFQDGEQALERARELGLESVVARRLRGRYFPGQRTREWLNIRPADVSETVICGWMEGRGARAGSIGSLVLGMYGPEGDLVYVGHTGIGLNDETLRTLLPELERREQQLSPLAGVPSLPSPPRWVRPEIVCRIRHHGWSDGKLHAPTFLGLVPESSPETCRLP